MAHSILKRLWRPMGAIVPNCTNGPSSKFSPIACCVTGFDRLKFLIQTQRCLMFTDPTEEALSLEHGFSNVSDPKREAKATAILENFTDTDQKKLLALKMEYDVWMSTGVRVPSKMTNAMWLEAFHKPSVAQRRKVYNFWCLRERIKVKEVEKAATRQEKHLARQAAKHAELEEEARDMGYPEGRLPPKSTIFQFIRPKTMLQHHYSNMAWSMQFGQDLVFDVSFEDLMKNRELSSVVTQIRDAYAINKVQLEPFHWHFTGFKPNGILDRLLQERIAFDHEHIPMTVSSESYLDLFPKEKLVYLTPDSKEELIEWDHTKVYIVGALVDLSAEKPLTFSKARREGIQTLRLPLDRYYKWELGSKALTLNQVMSILCIVKETGDWPTAFKHIPKRKATLRPQYDAEYKSLLENDRKIKMSS